MVINGSDTGGRMRRASGGMRVACGLLAGVVTGVVAAPFTVPSAAILLGWDVAVALYWPGPGPPCGGWIPA